MLLFDVPEVVYKVIFLGGGVVLVALFLVTLSYRKKAAQSRSSFEDMLNTSGQGLIIFDEEGVFFTANETARQFLPVLCEQDGGLQSLTAFLDYLYDNAADLDEGLKMTLGNHEVCSEAQGFREIIKLEEGKFCLVEVRKTDAKRTIITLIDVSHIKEQEESFIKLNKYSQDITEAVEAATNGIIIIDPNSDDYPTLFANRAFCQYVGLSRSQVIAQGLDLLIRKINDQEQTQEIYNALKGQVSADLEISIGGGYSALALKNGEETEEKWFNLELTPVKDRKGRLKHFIGVFTDTSELKYRDAEVSQSQKLEALGKLAAGVAHDFNNILSIIDGYSRLAVNEAPEGGAFQEYFKKIRTATQRGADLTRQMLTFSRQKIATKTVIDLVEVVTEQKTLLAPLLDASINFIIHAEPEDFFVECAPDMISQVLMNLVVNGRDAMPDGGSLLVDIRRCEDTKIPSILMDTEENDKKEFVCLHITDTGEGMEQNIQDKIFDPFFTTKDQGKGTGLGLSMVYGLLRQVGGHIDVRSAPGQGTTFSVYLPLTDQLPTQASLANDFDIDTLCLEGYTALVAEDEPDLRVLVCDMLEKLGMTVIYAENGNDALAKQDDYDGNIDILISDVVMPEMNGVKLSELFLSLRPESKVIFMSGYPADGQLAKVQLPKDAYFMAKPVQYEELARLVFQRLSEKSGEMAQQVGEMFGAHWTVESEEDEAVEREKK